MDTLEALLLARQDMQRGRLFLHFGDALVERLAGFIEGYHACMHENRLPDDRYCRFREWLAKVKQEQPMEEAHASYLRKAHGDHEQAIRNYLDLVSEFAALGSEQSRADAPGHEPNRATWQASPHGVIQYLLQVLHDLGQGRLRAYMGEVDTERFNALVDGYNSCMEANHLANENYVRFRDWLRDVKQELPGEGWPARYLRDCGGDPERAIRKYLDLVSEFAALNR